MAVELQLYAALQGNGVAIKREKHQLIEAGLNCTAANSHCNPFASMETSGEI